MNTAKLHRSSASPNNPTERPVFRSKLNDGQWDIASSCHANLPSIALSSDPAAARELLRSLRAPPFLQEKLLIPKINQYDSMLRVSWFCSQPQHHLGCLMAFGCWSWTILAVNFAAAMLVILIARFWAYKAWFMEISFWNYCKGNTAA